MEYILIEFITLWKLIGKIDKGGLNMFTEETDKISSLELTKQFCRRFCVIFMKKFISPLGPDHG